MAKKKKPAAKKRAPKRTTAKATLTHGRHSLQRLIKKFQVGWYPPDRTLPAAVQKLRDKEAKGWELTDSERDLLIMHSEPLRSILQENYDRDRELLSHTESFLESLGLIIGQLERGETDDALRDARYLQMGIERADEGASKRIAAYEDRFPEGKCEPLD